MNFYNDIEPYACQWTRNLIGAGEIPEGVVDGRSIEEITPEELRDCTQCHFFCGIAGWPLALRLAGVPADFPLFTGSVPCQSYSVAGKQKGMEDERDLWPVFFNLLKECKPPVVFGEQVEGAIAHGWLDRMQSDLESEGYAVGYAVLPAACVGAPHQRHRIFWGAVYLPDAETGRRLEINSQRAGSHQRVQTQGCERSQYGSGTGGIPNTECPGVRLQGCAEASGTQTGVQGADGQRQRIRNDVGTISPGGVGSVHDATSQGGCGRESSRARGYQESGRSSENSNGNVCPKGHTDDSRLQGLRGSLREESGYCTDRRQALAAGDAWSDYTVQYYRDGKYRRVGRGVFPLAHGLPRSMGQVQSGLERMADVADISKESLKYAKRNRVGRLKGYGNAIVPAVAAVFIRAFLASIWTMVE